MLWIIVEPILLRLVQLIHGFTFRRIQSEGRNFDNIQDLLDILLIEASILSVDVLPPQEATERVGPIHEPPPIIEVCETASLKRNSNATEPTCSNDELIEGEAPAKKSKTGRYNLGFGIWWQSLRLPEIAFMTG